MTRLADYTSGLLNRYRKRPQKLENLTLAYWAAWYDCAGKPYIKQTDELDIDGLPVREFLLMIIKMMMK